MKVAQTIAEQAHKDQKYGEKPYINHVKDVVNAVRPELKPAAWLHDTIEDTGADPRKLADFGISPRTIDTVQTLTRRPSETYSQYIDRVSINPDAREIKLADLNANMRTLPEDSTLRSRYADALDKLNKAQAGEPDPRVVQAEADARVAANPYHADRVFNDLRTERENFDAADEVILTDKGAGMRRQNVEGKRALDQALPAREQAEAATNFEDLDRGS